MRSQWNKIYVKVTGPSEGLLGGEVGKRGASKKTHLLRGLGGCKMLVESQ